MHHVSSSGLGGKPLVSASTSSSWDNFHQDCVNPDTLLDKYMNKYPDSKSKLTAVRFEQQSLDTYVWKDILFSELLYKNFN